jgi:hypothetical protein
VPAAEPVFDAESILRVLRRHGVEFVVVGGIAVQAHGYIRFTRDLDVIIRPNSLNASRLSEALTELEAELRTPGALRLTDQAELRRAPLIPLMTRGGPLDVLHVEHIGGAPRSYDALREAALVIDLDGCEVPVAGLGDLIRMKRAAGREQDLMDIEALTRDPEST